MKKQTTLNAPPHAHDASIPPWGDKHLAAWDRAKEALRRDWEQTLSDLSSGGGASLNQSAADTVRQVTGDAPVPARVAKTHPDAPADVARHEAEVAAVREDIASMRAQANEEIEREQREGEERLRRQQEKIDEVRATVRARVAGVREKADLEIARQRERIAELRREWGQIEPAVRYGYGARLEHDDDVWDERVEGRLMIGWAEMHSGGVWEDARPFVRHGWDAVRTEGPL